MIAPVATPAARPRTPQAKPVVDDPEADAAQAALAQQQLAFDADTAEAAELARERAAMETLMMTWLKDEDAIMKKWIEMI